MHRFVSISRLLSAGPLTWSCLCCQWIAVPQALPELTGGKISLPNDGQDVQEQELFSSTTGSMSGSINDGLALQSTQQLLTLSARADKSLACTGYQTTGAVIMLRGNRVLTGQPAPAQPAWARKLDWMTSGGLLNFLVVLCVILWHKILTTSPPVVTSGTRASRVRYGNLLWVFWIICVDGLYTPFYEACNKPMPSVLLPSALVLSTWDEGIYDVAR